MMTKVWRIGICEGLRHVMLKIAIQKKRKDEYKVQVSKLYSYLPSLSYHVSSVFLTMFSSVNRYNGSHDFNSVAVQLCLVLYIVVAINTDALQNVLVLLPPLHGR